ncbi:transcription antitermination factor NusB [Kordiimonas pumila]|uniref:Transcription antitermination protein NusB n=1 Tax=Kordiimonas pumila TaxID=2161677 RepID=A0ABV7D374_9PROT|nr:transcription antitermination factor NusB [Kordiimonas pumila]
MASESPKQKMGGPRSAARLGCVQALYQLDMSDEPNVDRVINEYKKHRLGAELEGDQYIEADPNLFADITDGAWGRKDEWDAMIVPCLAKGWTLDRIEAIVRAIFRAGCYELVARPDVPTAVIINEYIDVAHAFYDRSEISFVNGVLDKLAKTTRPK